MTARCASCSYPLTISDSISCYECTSYFHIDCAQLFGFPYYELSSDSNRNTFHCSTCKLLPLPRRQCDTDSDSDSESFTMPSRQQDCQLEGQGDYSKDMNEIKGGIQDLSDLCKDMLREINELKSVNLTLRCCIENIRHDNEKQDMLIAELKRRLDLFEKDEVSLRNKTKYSSDFDMDKEEETELYFTPDRECINVEEMENLTCKKDEYNHTAIQKEIEEQVKYFKGETQEFILEFDKNKTDFKTNLGRENVDDDLVKTEFSELEKEKNEDEEHIETDQIRNSEFDMKSEIAIEREINVRDWTWAGSKAIEIKAGEENESEQEEEGNEESEEEEDTQGWEILHDEVETEETAANEEKDSHNFDYTEFVENPQNEKKTHSEKEEPDEKQKDNQAENLIRHKTHADEETWDLEDNKADKTIAWDNDEDVEGEIETYDADPQSSHKPKRQRTESEALEEGEKASVKGEEVEGSLPDEGAVEKLPAGVEGDVASEEQISSVEADTALPEEEPRLEGEPLECEPGVEGDQRSGGQSPLEGEVQPTEPPLPMEPIHTEEDLWLYLKETVTSVHPATVEEFVQNLIGTLQQVPEEYLKPVIDANIKRATSPSVTDGEPQTTLEGINQEVVDESVPLESSTSAVSGTELTGDPIGEETQVPEGESTIGSKDEPLNFSEEPAIDDERLEVTEGYSAVEATA